MERLRTSSSTIAEPFLLSTASIARCAKSKMPLGSTGLGVLRGALTRRGRSMLFCVTKTNDSQAAQIMQLPSVTQRRSPDNVQSGLDYRIPNNGLEACDFNGLWSFGSVFNRELDAL